MIFAILTSVAALLVLQCANAKYYSYAEGFQGNPEDFLQVQLDCRLSLSTVNSDYTSHQIKHEYYILPTDDSHIIRVKFKRPGYIGTGDQRLFVEGSPGETIYICYKEEAGSWSAIQKRDLSECMNFIKPPC